MTWRTAALTAALIVAPVALQAAPHGADPSRDLGAIQNRIRSLQHEISRAAAQRPTAGKALKEAEMLEGGARQSVQEIQQEMIEARAREQRLRRQISDTETKISAQRAELEGQLRIAYMNGRQQGLRLVLSEQDPAAFSRKLTYYGYVARQRNALLDQVQQELAAMQAAAESLREELQHLSDLGARRQAHAEELAAARKVRALAVATIDRNLGDRQQRLTRLQQEARGLEELISRLEQQRRRKPRDTESAPAAAAMLGGPKDLPLKGRPIGEFGQPRADGLLRWDGLLLAAPAGADVRAVRGGRVVYAEYLPGMGQLVVLDHGDGYMSLYGHNQDLARKTGDRVAQGEVIAHVGDSGGEGTPALYFELRKNGQPVNPRPWVR